MIIKNLRHSKLKMSTFKINRNKFYLLYLFYFFLLTGCADQRTVEPSFYHWKSNWAVGAEEQTVLSKLAVKKLYVRFFDVAWDGAIKDAKPVASLSTTQKLPKAYSIIPTIYITNATMLNTKPTQLGMLVNRIQEKLQNMLKALDNPTVSEIQFDCDWSLKSKSNYFEFLKRFQAKIGKDISLSATIRLHQIKFYEKTGVPPVAKGMLMFYNMGDIQNINTPNSILDLSIAQQYLYNFDTYPLTLDVALPLFSWGVLFRRGKTIKLLNNLNAAEITDTSKYIKLSDTRFQVKANHYLKGQYLYKKDEIRIENVPYPTLIGAAEMLQSHLKNPTLTVAFYHLDAAALSSFSVVELMEVCEALE